MVEKLWCDTLTWSIRGTKQISIISLWKHDLVCVYMISKIHNVLLDYYLVWEQLENLNNACFVIV